VRVGAGMTDATRRELRRSIDGDFDVFDYIGTYFFPQDIYMNNVNEMDGKLTKVAAEMRGPI